MLGDQFVDTVLVGKAHLHLGRMDIHIDIFRRDRNMYDTERIPMLHHVGLIPFLDRF